jgi:hypothetical protein
MLSSFDGHFPSFQYVHDITNLPKPLGHLFRHRWGSSQRLMYANEIVAHRKQGHRMRVVLDLL